MPFRFPTYYQINLRERQIIERLYAQGYKPGKIARQVFRSRSTITREIQRNGYPDKNGQWQYSAKTAQRFCEHRQRRTGSTRGPDRLHHREPSGNYIHTTPIIPVFRIRNHRGFHIELKRWLRRYQLSRWHDNLFGKQWRKSYNWLRKRCYSWEELGKRSNKKLFSPYLFYNRMTTRLRRSFARKFKYNGDKPALEAASNYRQSIHNFTGRRKFRVLKIRSPYFPPEPGPLMRTLPEKRPLTSPKPLHRAPVQHPDGTPMPENRLNLRLFKIPAVS